MIKKDEAHMSILCDFCSSNIVLVCIVEEGKFKNRTMRAIAKKEGWQSFLMGALREGKTLLKGGKYKDICPDCQENGERVI